MSSENELDFTAKNIEELAKRIREGTITKEELEKAAENTSEITGLKVEWKGFPHEFYTFEERLKHFKGEQNKEYKQTKLGE